MTFTNDNDGYDAADNFYKYWDLATKMARGEAFPDLDDAEEATAEQDAEDYLFEADPIKGSVWQIICQWVRRRIVLASSSCTLWRQDFYSDCKRFRLNPRWAIGSFEEFDTQWTMWKEKQGFGRKTND